MSKNILLIGDANHQFITNYSTWIAKNDCKVDILSFSVVKNKNKIYYDNVFCVKRNLVYLFILKLRGIRRFFRFFRYKQIIKKLPIYDSIHFHYINRDSYYLIEELRKKTNSKIIISIWGSDLYRLDSRQERLFLKKCEFADIITFTNEKSIEYFKNKYSWKKGNVRLCRFGLSPLKEIDKLKLSKHECKRKLAWNENKFAVVVGYNLSPAQQHIKILKELKSDQFINLRDNIQIILPITYGGIEKYKNDIIKELKELYVEYVVYDSFLSDEKIALIRKASDIMIQLQITDQFSGSMQEHLYADNVVITGSWLPYETLKSNGAKFIEIDNINEIRVILPQVLNNYEKYQKQTSNNYQIIKRLSSWEDNISNWIDLYKNEM